MATAQRVAWRVIRDESVGCERHSTARWINCASSAVTPHSRTLHWHCRRQTHPAACMGFVKQSVPLQSADDRPISILYSFIGPIPWDHSGPLCHVLSLLLWTSMRRRRATVAKPGERQCKTGGVRRLAVANGPNIFQMLLVPNWKNKKYRLFKPYLLDLGETV